MKFLITINRLLVLIALSVFMACGQGKPNQEEANVANDSNAEPEFFLYLVNTGQLQLRKEASLSAEVVSTVPQGTILFSEGVKSSKSIQAELDGVSYETPFYEVSDASGVKGWALGGALTAVYRGTAEEKPDVGQISSFATYLSNLNPTDFKSGGKAWTYVEENLSEATGALADAIFVTLEAYMHRVERKSDLANLAVPGRFRPEEIEAIFMSNFDAESNPFAKALTANGFRMAAADEMIFAVPDLRRFQDYFSPRVSPPMQRYLNQRTSEQRVPLLMDGNLRVPLSNFADLAVFWEKFNREYPKFLKSEETQISERWFRNAVLRGTDKKPLFNPENHQVNMDFRLAWSYVQNDLAGTEMERLVNQMVMLCQENEWSRSKKIDDFLAKLQD
ncbi:MAG: hypothetical protein H6569_10235 [Lewinellaceae bacterium]|nr:hypothetical protein [Lewinellaceae bacterium]